MRGQILHIGVLQEEEKRFSQNKTVHVHKEDSQNSSAAVTDSVIAKYRAQIVLHAMESFDGIKTTKQNELQFKRNPYPTWESCDVMSHNVYTLRICFT